MSKEVVAKVKLQIVAGQASPAPPVGPALAPHGVNLMDFVRQFNDRTKNLEEETIVPVVVTVYKDRSFNFVIKTPPASFLLKKAAGIAKGSSAPNKDKVGKVTRKQIEEIARIKLPDLNTDDLEAAIRSIEGTAKNMGLEIVSE
ncbi:MAG: 50S ribosomal protein L11 [Candidatus Saccharicenans sp.]|nr:50S ribosomal protein L11 [Candidatus Saccharicenans sp.]MDH7494170.1 50S ribosomal protein L11 [Candidatus Saccharicenans sp.]